MSDRALVLHQAMEHLDLTIQRSQVCVCSVCEGARHRGDAVMRQGWSHHETITVTYKNREFQPVRVLSFGTKLFVSCL